MDSEDAYEIAYALESYLDRGGSGYHDRDECLDRLRIKLCEAYANTLTPYDKEK